MNKNCDIVRDLAIQYIEKTISKESEMFVKKHLEQCEECKEYYKTLETKIGNENEQDKIVIKQFKKVHKHISVLKITLTVILIIILAIGVILWAKEQTFSNLVTKVSEKVEYLETLDNYKVTVKTIYNNFNTEDYSEFYTEYFYKDGKLKEESADSIFFKEDDSYDSISVFYDSKQIEYQHNNYIKERKGDALGVFTYVRENYKPIASTIFSLAFSVREDRFNGIECYVIRFGNSDSYRDIWVDKNSFITVREVNEKYSSFYSERVFTFEENVVTDEDVDSSILDTEKFNDYKRLEVKTELPKEQVEILDLFHID